jgi:DNA polymerase III alpha subunit
MQINQYSQVEITEEEAFSALYNKNITNLRDIFIDSPLTIEQFNHARNKNADKFPNLLKLSKFNISLNEFDQANQNIWFMPDEYKNFNISQWLFDQCTTDQQIARVATELELFVQFNLISVLQYLKYLVDTMRAHNILWGVGRGSSVSSYCLYLMGVHKVDSILFELDITEFLK